MPTDPETNTAQGRLCTETPPVRVLLIRPEANSAPEFRTLLENLPGINLDVSVAALGAAAAANYADYRLILLDGSGDKPIPDAIQRLRETSQLPVIVINGADDVDSACRAAEAGAMDYIPKTILTAEILARSINYAIKCQEMTACGLEYKRMQEDFVAHISHELRTPLNSILGFTQLLQEGDIEDPTTRDEFLSIVMNQGQLLSRLIDNLLDISVLNPEMFRTEMSPCQPVEFIRQALEANAEAAAEKQVKLGGEYPESLPQINADATRLARAVGNLLSNAIKYSDGDTEVWLRASADKRQITISVTDHGIGIAEESIPYLFDRFYAAGDQDHQPGAGMGLYLTRAIVEAHGGNIWAESKLGEGSSFYITLPLHRKKKERENHG